jgi:N-acyl homoserine lactone hydrolase
MMRSGVGIAAIVMLSVAAAASAQKSAADKLYILNCGLNCGEGVAGDISRWSPGVNVGKSMEFVDNCYLIHHTQG